MDLTDNAVYIRVGTVVKGSSHSEETRRKMSDSHQRRHAIRRAEQAAISGSPILHEGQKLNGSEVSRIEGFLAGASRVLMAEAAQARTVLPRTSNVPRLLSHLALQIESGRVVLTELIGGK